MICILDGALLNSQDCLATIKNKGQSGRLRTQ